MPSNVFRVRLKQLSLLDLKFWPPQNCGPGHGQKEAQERRTRFRDTTSDQHESVEFDAAAAQLITDDLELELEPIRYGLYRYTKYGFRPKSRGLGGSLLGDAGEVLTFVLRQKLNAVGATDKLIRVVGYVSQPAGGPFPMPDFIVMRPTAGNWALEVKAREAFDVLDLETQQATDRVGACDAIKGAREEALTQLGFPPKLKSSKKVTATTATPFVPPTHDLKLLPPHLPVPFPVSGGVAVAVLVRDARVADIKTKGIHHLRGKENCGKFSCNTCFEETTKEPIHVTIVEMPNTPDVLSVLGSPNDSVAWCQSYGRWRQALWAREPAAVAETTLVLAKETQHWLKSVDENRRPVVMAFWGRYLRDAANERGVTSRLVIEGLATEAAGMPMWKPAVSREAEVRSLLPIEYIFFDLRSALGRVAFHENDYSQSWCLDVTEENIRLTVLTSLWWGEKLIADAIESVVSEAMKLAVILRLLPANLKVRTRPAIVKISNAPEVVGMHASGVLDTFAHWTGRSAVWRLSAFEDGRVLIEVTPATSSIEEGI